MRKADAAHTPDVRELYGHGDFFVARSALLPFAELVRVGGETGSPSAEQRSAEVAKLWQAFGMSELREGIFFASSRLDAALGAGRERASFELTLAKYLARSCTRPTPFGVFAGLSMGRVAASTRLELGPRDAYRRHTRPSAAFLGELMARAAGHAELADGVRYEVNPSAYRGYDRFRFSRAGSDGKSHPVVDVKPSPELERALAAAATGARLDEIAEALAAPGAVSEGAMAYVRSLVEHAVLLPCWLPNVTGPPPLAAASRALASHRSMRPLAEVLDAVGEQLARLDGEPLGSDVDGLRDAARILEGTAEALGFECTGVLQADLIKPAPDLTLGVTVVERMLDAARLIQRTGVFEPDPDLSEFCRRFTERYGERWVALVEALDGALGIGFGHYQRRATDALVHGLGLEARPAQPPARSELDELKLTLLTRALRSGATEVALDDAELERWPTSVAEPLPESFAVLAQLGCRDGRTLIVDPLVLAPSGVATLARFCHADPELERAVRQHAAVEQARAGGRWLADVAYQPPGEVGNILSRPSLRAVEIRYAGNSGASAERQVSISDLYLSVANGRAQLYSRRLRRPVAIRIGNAHAHDAWQNLPIYRFLAALEAADRSALPAAWSWGSLQSSPFLPRVVSGDVVLSRARWLLGGTELAALAALEPARTREGAQALRERLRLPRWVMVSRGETPLVTDLESILGVECFVHEARRGASLWIEELLPTPDELAMQGPEGRYASEVVVPFVLRRPAGHGEVARDEALVNEAPALAGEQAADIDRPPLRARSFAPGSEWLYAKLYAGPALLDALAVRVALDLVPSLPEGTLACWFYVPYADPEAHLRLRFRGDPGALLAHVLPALQRTIEPHRATGAVYRVQLDTYEREIERYGGELGIELAEQAFQCDSEASAHVLASCAERAEPRWSLTLLGVERLLADFAPELTERARMVEALLDGYRREFAVGGLAMKAIGARYRARADRLRSLLWPEDGQQPPGSEVEGARAIYGRRSERLAPIVERFGVLMAEDQVQVERSGLVASLVHMHVIRMLGARARSHELLMYDFLRRLYASRQARASLVRRAKAG